MTGILPIKKDRFQSAVSDFKEYSMIKPRLFGEYVGFTEQEVKALCDKHGICFDRMRQWYGGYAFRNVGSIYNPCSVMQVIYNDDFDSYWTESTASEELMDYISKDYNGLTKTIAELIGGVDVKVNTNGFANDLVTFKGKDDVLTLMIHLGYLAYNSETNTVHIPNEEVRREFQKSIREVSHQVYAKTSGFLVRIMSANEKNGHTRSGNDQKKSISRVSQMRRTVNAGYGERTSLSEGFAEQRLNNKRPSL